MPEFLVRTATLGPFRVEFDVVHRPHMPVAYENLCFVEPSCPFTRHCIRNPDYALSSFFYERNMLEWQWDETTRAGAILAHGTPVLGFRQTDRPSVVVVVRALYREIGLSLLTVAAVLGALVRVKKARLRPIVCSVLALTLVTILVGLPPSSPRGAAPSPSCYTPPLARAGLHPGAHR